MAVASSPSWASLVPKAEKALARAGGRGFLQPPLPGPWNDLGIGEHRHVP